MFHNTRVNTTIRHWRSSHPAQNLAVCALSHMSVIVEMASIPSFPSRRLGFERGMAGINPQLIDPFYLRPVLESQRLDPAAVIRRTLSSEKGGYQEKISLQ